MSQKQHFLNPSFSFGQVDKEYLFRADNENVFTRSCQELRNFDILDSGAVQRRGKTIVRDAFVAAGSTILKSFVYRRASSILGNPLDTYLLFFYADTAAGNTRCRYYNVDTAATGIFIVSTTELSIQDLQIAQIANTLFLVDGFNQVLRLDDINQAATTMRPWFEVTGLWDGAEGGTSFTASSGIFTRANEEVGVDTTTGGSIPSEILFRPPALSGLTENSWLDVNEAVTTVAGVIPLNASTIIASVSGARLYARYTTDQIGAVAIGASRNRLIYGGIIDTQTLSGGARGRREPGYDLFEASRLIMSGISKPQLLFPSSDFDDSPLDFTMVSQVSQIQWIQSTETATYIGGTQAIAVVPSSVTLKTLDIRSIDEISVSSIKPCTWNNGIVYLTEDKDRLMWLRFDFNRGAEQSAMINRLQPTILNNVVDVNVAQPGDSSGSIRRIFCVNGDGTVSVAFDNDGEVIGWSTYDFPSPIVSVESVGSRVFMLAQTASTSYQIYELLQDEDYVGDTESTVTIGATSTVSEPGLLGSEVAIYGDIAGETLFIGMFHVTAGGVIQVVDNTDPDAPVFVNADLTAYTNAKAMLIFESRLIPFPAMGVDQEGRSISRLHRIIENSVFVVDTRSIAINGHTIPEVIPLAIAGQKDLPKKTDWFGDGEWGHDKNRDTIIDGRGIYQAKIAGLVREVGT